MDGIIRIERVVAHFEVWVDDSFPFAKIKVKVIERECDFLAIANVAVVGLHSRQPEWIAGLAGTLEEATEDLLTPICVSGTRALSFFWVL